MAQSEGGISVLLSLPSGSAGCAGTDSKAIREGNKVTVLDATAMRVP